MMTCIAKTSDGAGVLHGITGKNLRALQKHGVSFDEAVEAMHDPLLVTVLDERHAAEEKRFFSVGESKRGRLLTIGHTDEDDVIRIITARDATRLERGEIMNGEGEEFEEMPAEVDFSQGVRGRFAGRTHREAIVMEIDADAARVVPCAADVNTALRVLMKAAASADVQISRRVS